MRLAVKRHIGAFTGHVPHTVTSLARCRFTVGSGKHRAEFVYCGLHGITSMKEVSTRAGEVLPERWGKGGCYL